MHPAGGGQEEHVTQVNPNMNKIYISPQQLLDDSQQLAFKVIDSGYRPDLIIGIWRGGTPVGIALQEILEFAGLHTDHISIRTSSYKGIGQRGEVRVDGLEYIEKQLRSDMNILLVDDIYDTGLSLQAVIAELQRIAGDEHPPIRIATPYFKPGNNKTTRTPDYYLHANDDWLVFPHELLGLSASEIAQDKPGIDSIRSRLLALIAD